MLLALESYPHFLQSIQVDARVHPKQSLVVTTQEKHAFEKFVGEGNLLVTSIFSFCHNVFNPAKGG